MKPLNYNKKLITVLFALFLSTSASAGIVIESLVGEVFHGPYTGETGSGTFSYDTAFLIGVGEETLGSDKISVEFTIFDQNFTNVNDLDYPSFPVLDFIDGNPVSLEFAVFSGIIEPGVEGFEMFELISASSGGFETEVTVTSVPLPLSVWLFSSGLLGLIGYSRNK